MHGEQLQFGDDEHAIALQRTWDRALHVLASRVNKLTLESYIRPIRPLAFRDQEFTLGVASPFAREWLDKRYRALIASAIESVVGCPIDVRFQVLSIEDRPVQTEASSVQPDGPKIPRNSSSKQSSGRRCASNQSVPGLPLIDRYTFDNFVVGKTNRLAQASAVAVANSPGSIYNPLFLYGGPGLGKTHILHAIGHAAQEANPEARVALIDGETFTCQFVASLRERKTEEFRRKFRSVDIWLIDDVQFIAGKEATKEEFFHTFNALYQSGKQIVIASDRSPREMRAMDERIRSRFECGLVADITPPELETRMAILDRRCSVEEWEVPQEVIYYIASMIRSNIRALEGALTKLIAYSSIMRSPISVDLVQSVLGDYLIEKPLPGQMRKGISLEIILAAVAEQFKTTTEVLRGQRRDRPAVTARQLAMYLCREMTGTCLAQIGATLGGRDHTTIQRGIARIESQLKIDAGLQTALQETRNRLDR